MHIHICICIYILIHMHAHIYIRIYTYAYTFHRGEHRFSRLALPRAWAHARMHRASLGVRAGPRASGPQ
jgi:hypothetical protein